MVKDIHEILEQNVIFGDKPNFMCGGAVINLLNHYSYADIEDAKDDGHKSPKKYLVRIIVETELIE